MLSGIRSCVIPVIAASVISLWKSAVKDTYCIMLCLTSFVLSAFIGIGNIEIMLISLAVACILAFRRKSNGTH